MTIRVSAKMKKLVERRMKAGGYATAEEVILAGLAALEQNESIGNFAPGELAALIAEGEESLKNEPTLTLEEAYRKHLTHRQRRARRQQRRKSA
jgi:Arc/MetJ-type ribon-helix-helix transcriptional regulator